MSIHSVAAAVVPANIFDSGATAANNVRNLLMAIAVAVIAWLLLKMLSKAGTFLAAGMAILVAIILFWGLGQVNNSSIQQNLTNTVNDTFGMAPARGGVQDVGGPSR